MTANVTQNILVLSNEPQVFRQVQEVLARKGILGVVTRSASDAMVRIEEGHWDMLLCDIDLKEGEPFDVLARARRFFPERPVVVLGQEGATVRAVRAIKEGCRDFLPKPITSASLDACVERCLPNHHISPAGLSVEGRDVCYIAGKNSRFLQTIRLAQKAAPTSAPILITGESGTGKELLSFLAHRSSSRSHGPYIRVNCAALSDSLLESELFGHERGAFTGAYAQRKGRFELANGGTLLLDEISETSLRLQAELLRVLEQQDFERVGGSERVQVNVRVISTTNRDLTAEMDIGRFRRDLYYRLCGIRLNIPPLRERPEDIPVLVWHFVNLYAREAQRPITALDDEMLDAFSKYPWPGNVRQLRNIVRTALALGDGPVLSLEGIAGLEEELSPARGACQDSPTLQLQEMERRTILEALKRTQRNQVKAARLLGITDRTLREKLRRYRQEGRLETVGEAAW
jgi:DNA-binding NtrC family response regulator